MSSIGTDDPLPIVHLPQLDLRVHGAGEEQMSTFREPLQIVDAFIVATVRVDKLLGHEAAFRTVVFAKVDTCEARRHKERTALVVFGFFHWKPGGIREELKENREKLIFSPRKQVSDWNTAILRFFSMKTGRNSWSYSIFYSFSVRNHEFSLEFDGKSMKSRFFTRFEQEKCKKGSQWRVLLSSAICSESSFSFLNLRLFSCRFFVISSICFWSSGDGFATVFSSANLLHGPV